MTVDSTVDAGPLDRLPRTALRLGPWTVAPFAFCVGAGFATGGTLATVLAAATGRSPGLMAAILLGAVVAFFVVGLATKVVYGDEVYVFFHHALATVGAAVVVIWAAGAPVLPYLDLTVAGTLGALIVVKLGCLFVGCCYGRPAHRGIRYRPTHAEAGFPSCYVGVRTFPVQVVEAGWAVCMTVVTAGVVLAGGPAGSGLTVGVTGYAVGRLFTEPLRGDSGRAYLLGLSQAQWLSVVVLAAVGVLTALQVLPWTGWQLGVAVVGLVLTAAVGTYRLSRRRGLWQLATPRRLREFAELLDHLDAVLAVDGAGPHVHATSAGLLVSAARTDDGAQRLRHYTVSSHDGRLTERAMTDLADLVGILRCAGGTPVVIASATGTCHLLMADPVGGLTA
ncbi:hypothetical protein Cch01nite_32120 [Cellulomonas chitinilytica]|uniref:Uncharacterized protein n=1 Tax=Cellulomonas chitinilytica TaxID=398759 RepID=A0A919P3C3_9CELL|nr:prolipoprotein diacylglyceryl transferase family protein [Cellulomonas chitinilytica]GIG22488.1 hypothetical protein Cch01nite_32120 [Cellulomonas chitinilytica]